MIKVSVIIVNWNGKKWLKECIESILRQDYQNLEIIFIDNASTDDSVDFIKINYPKVIVKVLSENFGFAKANNIGNQIASGEYILLLNNDTKLKPDCISEMVKGFIAKKNAGAIQAKLVRMGNEGIIDSCGSFLTLSTILYHYGVGKKSNKDIYSHPFRVFSSKGACMMIKAEAIKKVGLFDGRYWCYYEESDFCHRIINNGFECWYWPNAVCEHHVGGTSVLFGSEIVQYHNLKNKLCSYIKNFSTAMNVILLPTAILAAIMQFLPSIIKGNFKSINVLYSAVRWNLVNINDTLALKKKYGSNNFNADMTVLKKYIKRPGLSYYLALFKGLEEYNDIEIGSE
ncbi:glycosyltransferase family 2 protein [Polynucleobacter sp. MWH-UH35A]|uniref:glycosyltransferase family 2 protein n=1 Tax=Polynucleobacter sp. MWH-UH35A TaxID=1855619 RepID=UPI001BFEDDAF|nr:glycosyltransferase family 2 protein [Polynucleobacter sp. MWH-UH35A]QWD60445.1 glycosyltransferase family 2 protein [Polynucleobacter sp. MWH-UH35A]